MQSSTKISIGVSLVLFLSIYLLINSSYYHMIQLDHVDDRIRFGRLEFHKKANITVGKIEIHNRQKIFTVNFDGQIVFVGDMEHFLVLMQAQGKIEGNGESFFDITDQVKKICKIQNVLSLYPDQDDLSIRLQGRFQDCDDAYYTITFRQTQQNKLQIHVQAPQKYQRIYMLFNYDESHHYYGLGEQFSYLNLGQNCPYSTFIRQKGIGRGQQPLTLLANILYGAGGSYYSSYASMPIWYSSKRIAYILNSYNYMAWMNNKILVWSNKFTVTYIKQSSYKQLVKQIALINGYTRQVPNWVNEGAILGVQGGSKSVLQKYRNLKSKGAKITGLWIQDWVGKRQSLGNSRLWWNWQLDEHQYEDWDQMRQQLKKDNVELLIYINPMLTDARDKKEVKQNFFQNAEENGYFIKDKKGQTFKIKSLSDFEAGLIDFENPKAVQFFKQKLKNALNQTGAKGMMVDFSQGFPANQANQTIQQGAALHNEYPTLYHKAINETVKQIFGDQNDFYTFARAGYLNSPKYTHSLWAGDQTMNFDFHNGLPSCLTAILSSGLVGYSNTHCDIGGYIHIKNDYISFTHRTQSLLIRWMQLAAFTSVFRSHEGNMPDDTLQVYSNQLLSHNFAFYSRVYSTLSQYRKQQIRISKEEKFALVRPLFLQLQGVQGTQELQDQFFLGSQIFVAPFISQQSERKYFLPKGQWRALWDGKIYKGCDCQRVWKQTLPPVFIRSSSLYSQQILTQISNLVEEYKHFICKLPQQSKQEL